MNITALVKRVDHVCCRYRLAAFRTILESAGHQFRYCSMECSFPGSWLAPGRLPPSDVIILQRALLPSWQLAILRKRARYLVFDFDDAVFLRDSYDPRGLTSSRRLSRFVRTVKLADAVIAGNDYLAQEAAWWVGPSRVRLIPTCVNVDQYPCAVHQRRPGVQMVWIGSGSTLRGLKQIGPLLNRLGQKIPNLSLKILCDESITLEDLPVQFVPWSTETEAAELAGADFGISWLPDDDWSKGKCGLKVLQYMAAGLPVLANPVGVQAHFVEQGATGFLARSPEEWLHALELLVQRPSLRGSLGERARFKVKNHFTVQHGGAGWLALLEQLPNGLAPQLCRET
jgi:glycosyltransferase involved in cell wall biosynthesis